MDAGSGSGMTTARGMDAGSSPHDGNGRFALVGVSVIEI